MAKNTTFRITDDCIYCGACAVACQLEAIIDDMDNYAFVIDQDKCKKCYMCEEACPIHAIIVVEENQEA